MQDKFDARGTSNTGLFLPKLTTGGSTMKAQS
jgi:hypothetical protein